MKPMNDSDRFVIKDLFEESLKNVHYRIDRLEKFQWLIIAGTFSALIAGVMNLLGVNQ